MRELRKRKPNRLRNYDYSKNGAYFVTICSKDRVQIFSTISDRDAGKQISGGCETHGGGAGEHSSPLRAQITQNNCRGELRSPDAGSNEKCSPDMRSPERRRSQLTEIGLIIENEIKILSNTYANIHVSDFVIMPNHIHMVIIIEDDGRMIESSGRTQYAPTVSRVIKQWKGVISKKIGFSPWQKSFHDHIIRNEDDYIRISEYIANNLQNWKEDCFFTEVQK
jgi:REP element-mobilizing transposase RayT